MHEFINNLPLTSILWYITIPATVLFLFTIAGSFFDVVGDVDTDFDDVSGKSPIFTFRNFITFFTFLGWGGLIGVNVGLGNGMSIIVGLVSAIVMVSIVTTLFLVFNRLREDNTTKLSDVINTKGKVYLTIPKDGRGKVNVILGGEQQTIDASAKDGEEIKTGSPVKVIETTGTELIVEQI